MPNPTSLTQSLKQIAALEEKNRLLALALEEAKANLVRSQAMRAKSLENVQRREALNRHNWILAEQDIDALTRRVNALLVYKMMHDENKAIADRQYQPQPLTATDDGAS